MRGRRLLLGCSALFILVAMAGALFLFGGRTPPPRPLPITVTAQDLNRQVDALKHPGTDLNATANLLHRMVTAPDAGEAYYGCGDLQDRGKPEGVIRWQSRQLQALIDALLDQGEAATRHKDWKRAERAWQLAVDATQLPVNTRSPEWIESGGVRVHMYPVAAGSSSDELLEGLRKSLQAVPESSPKHGERFAYVLAQVKRMQAERRAWQRRMDPALRRDLTRSNAWYGSLWTSVTKSDIGSTEVERLAQEQVRYLKAELPKLRRLIGESTARLAQGQPDKTAALSAD